MKKHKSLTLVAAFLFSVAAVAQIPNGYYDGTQDLEGFELKTKLFQIIGNFNAQSYNDLKDLYKSTHPTNGFRDRYYEMDNTVLDVYSENPDGTDPYNYNPNSQMGSGANEGSAFNREHLIPQSYFNQALPMRADAFHVWPVDSKVNGWRGNDAIGPVDNPQNANPCNNGATNHPCKSKNGTLKGKFGSTTVLEPIDEFKGDIARAFLYFATAYENKLPNFYNNSAGVKAMFDGSKNKAFSDKFLNVLIEWHLQDPPSQREIDLNDMIQYRFQGNRNPYIDHPELASRIWGIGLNTEDLEFQSRPDVEVYYAANKEVVIRLLNDEKSMDKISVYDASGKLVQAHLNKMNQKEFRLNIQQKGVYILKIEGKRLEFNSKLMIR